MNVLTIEYPESLPDTLRLTVAEFEREAKFAMAAKLFDSGRLTSGQAAELAGVPRVEFLNEVGRWGVGTIQSSIAELDVEIQALQHQHVSH